MDHFLHHVVERIDPQLAIMFGQSWFSFKKCSCILLTPLLWMAKVVLFYTECWIWLVTFNNDLLDSTIAIICWRLKDFKKVSSKERCYFKASMCLLLRMGWGCAIVHPRSRVENTHEYNTKWWENGFLLENTWEKRLRQWLSTVYWWYYLS